MILRILFVGILVLGLTVSGMAQTDPDYPPAPLALVDIVYTEYFFNTDPGFGNGTAISVVPAQDISSIAVNLPTTLLPKGLNRLVIRSRDVNGKWSISNVKDFIVDDPEPYPSANPLTNVIEAEYFFDTDPGFGNGTAIAVSPNTDISSISIAPSTLGMSNGVHRLFVRTKSEAGKWSLTSIKDFVIINEPLYPSAPVAPENIHFVEYFIDADPGFGNGISIPVSPDTELEDIQFAIPVSGYTTGVHTLYIRTQAENGIWSLTAIRDFIIGEDFAYPAAPANASNIISAEYFIDDDPGFGNANAITLSPGIQIENVLQAIDVTTLSTGVHRFYLRTLNENGEWSLTNKLDFIKEEDFPYPTAPTAPGNITFVEYFIDTDPGFGNGHPIAITPDVDLQNIAFTITQTDTLSYGSHILYLRSFDDWSITNYNIFNVGGVVPLTLLTFTAAVSNEDVLLNWSTTNELNTAFFEIEFSLNGIDFRTIGIKNSQNSAGQHHYSFKHLNVPTGILFYRLKQIDLDGEMTYSNIIAVNVQKKNKLIVAPNPVQQVLKIKNVLAAEVEAVRIINAAGRIIKTFTANTDMEYDVQSLSSGSYLLIIVNKNGDRESCLFIKQ